MKRIITLFITVILTFSAVTVYGAQGITVLVNGTQVVSDVPAVVVNNNTMLPFRAIFNALGVGDDAIKWNENSKSIEVSYSEKYVFLVIGSTGAVVNDKLFTLNIAPYIENDRTYVPVRFVSEALGANVQWDDNTKTVTIIK